MPQSPDKKLVKQIKQRYKQAYDFHQRWHSKWAELDKFYRGEQYEKEVVPPWVPKPVTNYIHLVVNTKRASLAIQNPAAMLSATSLEDVEAVKKLQMAYEWQWDRMNMRKGFRDALETALLLGTGIVQIYYDEYTGVKGPKGYRHEGEICWKLIDPANFYPDPAAYELKDCRYIHVIEKVPKSWVEATFNVDLSGQEWDNAYKDGDIYYRDYYDGHGEEAGEGLVTLHCYYERYWNNEKMTIIDEVTGEEIEEEVGGWNYRCYYLVGDKIVYQQDPLKPNMYPFAILYIFKHLKEFWAKGYGELILENQKLVNKGEQIAAMIATLMQNPQKIIYKDSGIHPEEARKYSHAPGWVWLSNVLPEQAMKWQEPPPVPPAIFNLIETAKNDIREIAGMSEAYMGQSVGSLQTSSGVDSLIERATLRDKDLMFDIELFIEQLTRLIIAFMVEYYDTERYVKIIKDPSNPNDAEFMTFIGTDFKDLDYDIVIDVSSKTPISIQRRAQEAKELLTLQGQYAFNPPLIKPQEYIMDSDMVNKRERIERMNRDEKMNYIQLITRAAQMQAEAMINGVPPEEVGQMVEQFVEQMLSGKAPVQDPFNPAGLPPDTQVTGADFNVGGGGGIGNAADNTNIGQTQNRQASIPNQLLGV